MRTITPFCIVLGLIALAGCASRSSTFRAGEDSLKFNVAITADERRGEAPRLRPIQVKEECASLLKQLRTDGTGLKAETEFNIESYFTVADAFEADGLLVQSIDYLSDLKHKLAAVADARRGKKHTDCLIETEDDILHFRDAHNLHVFDSKYMAGAQPTERGYRWLKSKGVTTIVNLRLAGDHERKRLEALGFEYIHIPWADEHPPTIQQVQQMLDAVKKSRGKVMQHCLRGIGRDMTMAACYMIANHDKSAEELIKRGRAESPRWESDQKRDKKTGEPVQFKLLREFESAWRRGKDS